MLKFFSGIFIVILSLLLKPGESNAQYFLDIGGKIGAANYLGEIGGIGESKKFISDIQIVMTKPSFGGFARYRIFPWLYANAGFHNMWISGADSLSVDNRPRFSRNLSFRNNIIEIYGRGEAHFLRINDFGGSGLFRLDVHAYLFAGVAGFSSNPKTKYNDEWIALRPLQTEGVEYSKFGVSIPAGLGIFVTVGKHQRIGWEMQYNTTFTDYLDDVSGYYRHPDEFTDPLAKKLADRSYEVDPDDPRFIGTKWFSKGTAANPDVPAKRGNPDKNDGYLISTVTYSWVFRTSKNSFQHSKYNFVTGRVKKRKSRAKF